MTEAEFEWHKKRLRDGIAVRQKQIGKLHAEVQDMQDELIDWMGVAQQEAWFGEAND